MKWVMRNVKRNYCVIQVFALKIALIAQYKKVSTLVQKPHIMSALINMDKTSPHAAAAQTVSLCRLPVLHNSNKFSPQHNSVLFFMHAGSRVLY
jgi:hypothetical protein